MSRQQCPSLVICIRLSVALSCDHNLLPQAGPRQRWWRDRQRRYDKLVSYYIYILKSQTSGRYYIGSTENVIQRLGQHNSGKVRSTKNRGPYKLVYTEPFSTRQDAYRRERQIKRYKGGHAFRKLLENYSGIV